MWPADLARFLTARIRRVRTGVSLSSESEMSESLSKVPLDGGLHIYKGSSSRHVIVDMFPLNGNPLPYLATHCLIWQSISFLGCYLLLIGSFTFLFFN